MHIDIWMIVNTYFYEMMPLVIHKYVHVIKNNATRLNCTGYNRRFTIHRDIVNVIDNYNDASLISFCQTTPLTMLHYILLLSSHSKSLCAS